MAMIRHEYYESDERVTISVFDKAADPQQVKVEFEPRKLKYTHGDKVLELEPLKGQIDPDASDFTVGKVKVEIRLAKRAQGRWGALVGDAPDILANTSYVTPQPTSETRKARKDWEGITDEILKAEKEKDPNEDPNVGGDSTLNSFFQKLYGDADENTKRAMMKSYSESGGTTLSTNWDEVKKAPVDVKPPVGAEWKKWN